MGGGGGPHKKLYRDLRIFKNIISEGGLKRGYETTLRALVLQKLQAKTRQLSKDYQTELWRSRVYYYFMMYRDLNLYRIHNYNNNLTMGDVFRRGLEK